MYRRSALGVLGNVFRSACYCSPDKSASYGDTLLANLSGLSLPSGCWVNDQPFYYDRALGPGYVRVFHRFLSFPVNNTYCLTRVAGQCTWSTQVPVLIRLYFGNIGDGNCDRVGMPTYDITSLNLSVTLTSPADGRGPRNVQAQLDGIGGVIPLPAGYVVSSLTYPAGNYLNVDSRPLFYQSNASPVVTLACGGTATVGNVAYYCNDTFLGLYMEQAQGVVIAGLPFARICSDPIYLGLAGEPSPVAAGGTMLIMDGAC